MALAVCLIGSVLAPRTCEGRQAEPTTDRDRRVMTGFKLSMTNSGLGLGGYARDSLSAHLAGLIEISAEAGKDEREVAFFNRFGQRSVPGKANYLFVVPVRLGLQRRLFKDQIEDNFRPFIQVAVGPTLAWEYPYFFDCNGDNTFEAQADCNGDGFVGPTEGDERLSVYRALGRGRLLGGVGASFSIGSYFGRGDRGARGFRVGYSLNYYPTGARLLESQLDNPRRYFGTPHVVVYFGRLL